MATKKRTAKKAATKAVKKPARTASRKASTTKRRAAAPPRPKATAKKKVSWLAKGYPVLSPCTVLDRCAEAIDWYKRILGAKERLRFDMPNGAVAHCELAFGDSVVMLGSAMPPANPAKSAHLALYVKDCDATYRAAVAAGARGVQEPSDQFYGDRNARFVDPFGNEWSVGTHVKDVTKRQMIAAMKEMGG